MDFFTDEEKTTEETVGSQEPVENENPIIDEQTADKIATGVVTVVRQTFDWLDILVSAMVAVVLIFSFVFRTATIEGTSMLDTLHEGERVVISDLGYTPKYGDIVIISRNNNNAPLEEDMNNQPIIKRVIATEGQKVDIDFEKGIVYVDDKPLDEPYTSTPTTGADDVEFPVFVPEGHIFVLGDNRSISLDSRSTRIGNMGMIDERYVLGKVLFRVTPINKFGPVD